MKKIILLLSIFPLVALLFSCAPRSLQDKKPVLEKPSVTESQATVKAAWELEWEKTLAEAKKERYITIASGREEAVRTGLTEAFKAKYGIDIAWVVGRAGELAAKIMAERRAGLTTIDLHIAGADPSIYLKRNHQLQSVRAALILPEVKDEKAWLEGKLPFIDREGEYVFATTYYSTDTLHANTRLVPNYKEELASYYDLLKPKWKGKIVARDFIRPGGSLKWFSVMIERDFGPILGVDYMRELVKQEPMPIIDSRLAAEWITRGKYTIGLNLPIGSLLANWLRQGITVPVVEFIPKEGSYLSTGGQNLAFVDKAPHPIASKVFLNWLLTREGQVLLSKLNVKHSSRIDIPDPRDIDPLIKKREPTVNNPLFDQEKYLEKNDEYYVPLALEIFGPLYK